MLYVILFKSFESHNVQTRLNRLKVVIAFSAKKAFEMYTKAMVSMPEALLFSVGGAKQTQKELLDVNWEYKWAESLQVTETYRALHDSPCHFTRLLPEFQV